MLVYMIQWTSRPLKSKANGLNINVILRKKSSHRVVVLMRNIRNKKHVYSCKYKINMFTSTLKPYVCLILMRF